MRRSLLWRLAVPFIVLILVGIGGLAVYFSNYVERNYYDNLHQTLKIEAGILADQVKPLLQAGVPSSELESIVARFADLTGVRVTVIFPDGTVGGESLTNPSGMENHLTRPEVVAALSGEEGVDTRFSNTLKESFYYLALPVKIGEKNLGIVRVASSVEKINADLARLKNTILIISGIVIVLFLLVAFWVAQRTINPLKKLAKEVSRISPDNPKIELVSNRRDEIGQLNHSFTQLANRLSTQIEEFKEERGKLEAVLNNMTDGVLVIDEQGRVSLINPAAEKIFNTEPAQQVLGKSLAEAVRQYQLVDLWREASVSGHQQIATLETAPARLFIQAIATPLESSLPGSTLMVFQDLTRLRKLETVRRDFVSNVSHELRTPLASLKALTETLSEGALEDRPAAERFLNRMNNEIDNMTQLVRELLELSKIESGKAPLEIKPMDPLKLLNESVERMLLQAERAGLQLKVNADQNLPLVGADADRIEQVLVILIHNAIKFTKPGGQITIAARPENGFIEFSVADTGVGIAPDAIPRIFERFYKADQSRSGGGTGLGLSIARHIIETHGGKIWVNSKVDEGSTFYFSLPL